MGAMAFNLDETLLDVSNQMASSNLSRRQSRGSNGPRIGASARVSKTNSASNSPRNSTLLNRRKTVVGDGSYRRQRLAIDRNMPESADSSHAFHTPAQAPVQSRPLSWHPSACSTYDAPYQTAYQSTTMDYSMPLGNKMEHPSTPALFSNYGSPSSTFTPEPQPWTCYYPEYPFYSGTTSFIQPTFDDTINDCNAYAPYQLPSTTQTQDTNFTDCMNPSIYSHFDWNGFAVNGFENGTAPPTPENFLPVQHSDPPCAVENSIPYHSLDDDEDDGEILVGMGLYDTHEKESLPDLQLGQYRSVLMSQYMSSAPRGAEPAGKGLKLEETWEPPASDVGEEEDDQDGDNDADGSVADEDEQPSGRQGVVVVANNNDHIQGINTFQDDGQLHHRSLHQTGGWI